MQPGLQDHPRVLGPPSARHGVEMRQRFAQAWVALSQELQQLGIEIELPGRDYIDDAYGDAFLKQCRAFPDERIAFSGRSLFPGLTSSMVATSCRPRSAS